jgi:ribosome-associated toxin RatA of RatAB toxin-antitoxin module
MEIATTPDNISRPWKACTIRHTALLSVLLLLAAALFSGRGAAAEEALNIEDVTNDKGVKGLRATFQLNASREAIWDLLTDYDRFTETFTGIRSLEVISEGDQGARVRFKIKVAFLSFDYTLQRDYVRPYELITWRLTDGDFRDLSGSWGIIPGPAEGIQEVIYESFVDVGFLIPTALVRDGAARELEKTVTRMRARLEGS